MDKYYSTNVLFQIREKGRYNKRNTRCFIFMGFVKFPIITIGTIWILDTFQINFEHIQTHRMGKLLM